MPGQAGHDEEVTGHDEEEAGHDAVISTKRSAWRDLSTTLEMTICWLIIAIRIQDNFNKDNANPATWKILPREGWRRESDV